MSDKTGIIPISFVLPKGRLAEQTMGRLIECGISGAGVVDFNSRKLVFKDAEARINFLLVRNSDVPVYVEHGASDFGVVGKDILEESGACVYELADLGLGVCRMSVAAPVGIHTHYKHNMRVATKYPDITKKIFAQKGIFVEIIKLYGSIEIAPITGLSDYIVDLVDTGETLRNNGLEELEVIMRSTARLIANRNLARAKYERVKEILSVLERQ
ncbi:MAG: ATP phosphoribosyltransferase [Deferribacteraceae bacterium]|jgi:ATP phosphoribosyltransferase|nr:ATP phosphoribosyltransferase [Deferribacteraceae bacterium]